MKCPSFLRKQEVRTYEFSRFILTFLALTSSRILAIFGAVLVLVYLALPNKSKLTSIIMLFNTK